MSSQWVWVLYAAAPDCQCWRDALCSHGWTWQPAEFGEPSCDLRDYIDASVYVSFSEAMNRVIESSGPEAIGPLIRNRYTGEAINRGTARIRGVWVMPVETTREDLIDDHEADRWVAPIAYVDRVRIAPRNPIEARAYRHLYGHPPAWPDPARLVARHAELAKLAEIRAAARARAG